MRLSWAVLAISLAAPAAVLLPRAAHACSCVRAAGPVDAAREAAAVFEAKVESVEDFKDGTIDKRRYTMKILRIWKGGIDGETTTVVTNAQSSMCGREYTEGTAYMVYASANADGQLLDNACTRTRDSANAQEDFDALGTADGAWTAPVGPADPEPAPVEPDGEKGPNPFDRGDEGGPAADEGGVEPPEPSPVPNGKKGCAINGTDAGATALLPLAGFMLLRRRRRR